MIFVVLIYKLCLYKFSFNAWRCRKIKEWRNWRWLDGWMKLETGVRELNRTLWQTLQRKNLWWFKLPQAWRPNKYDENKEAQTRLKAAESQLLFMGSMEKECWPCWHSIPPKWFRAWVSEVDWNKMVCSYALFEFNDRAWIISDLTSRNVSHPSNHAIRIRNPLAKWYRIQSKLARGWTGGRTRTMNWRRAIILSKLFMDNLISRNLTHLLNYPLNLNSK